MKNITFFLGILCMFSLLFFKCQSQKTYEPKEYLNEGEKAELLIRLNAYIEGRPDGASETERYDSAHRQVYIDRSTKKPFYLHSLYQAENGRYFYQVVMHERKSLHDWKYRTVGGYYTTAATPHDFSEFDIIYYSKILKEEEAQEIGREIFEALIENKDIKEYQEHIEWPNNHVLYDKETNNWKMLDNPYL